MNNQNFSQNFGQNQSQNINQNYFVTGKIGNTEIVRQN